MTTVTDQSSQSTSDRCPRCVSHAGRRVLPVEPRCTRIGRQSSLNFHPPSRRIRFTLRATQPCHSVRRPPSGIISIIRSASNDSTRTRSDTGSVQRFPVPDPRCSCRRLIATTGEGRRALDPAIYIRRARLSLPTNGKSEQLFGALTVPRYRDS